ncbi:MAG: ribosome-associated translation inhibitor RaiA [Gammaproteobacteria bacterium]|nr:ribosome-associated translation inhibitor RaiA [Gammaproteobacteria bacterium]
MQINVTGHHVDVTEALLSYVKTKFERLERHFDIATQAHVVLTVEKLDQKAEATIHVAGGNLHADAVEGDMYAAIDALTDKLDRQMKRHKEKLTDHHRAEGGIKTMN